MRKICLLKPNKNIYTEKVYIFGITLWGLAMACYLKNFGHSVLFLDNDSDKQDCETIMGMKCIIPRMTNPLCTQIISVRMVANRVCIEEQLMEYGCSDICFLDESMDEYLKTMTDKDYIRCLWYMNMHYDIDITTPRTFNEKIQWLKLYDRNPLYTKLVDKYEVKQYVADLIGEKYIIPTLGVWDSFGEIDFDSLPNSFVLKCTHDSGSTIIVPAKNYIDKRAINLKIDKCLCNNYYYYGREWAYKDVKPRIIAEHYLGGESEEKSTLIDYKVHTFNGKPQFIQVISDRNITEHTACQVFYDTEWNRLDWGFEDFPMKIGDINKPECLKELLKLSSKLASEMKYARIDFYIIQGKIKFGEITLYPLNGMYKHRYSWTEEMDLIVGNLIDLHKTTT